MRLEAEDPHTSVTFVCLAASGTRIEDFFITDRSDRNHALGPGPPLPAQLDELHAIAGSRAGDILVLATGINDARAFELLGELIRKEIAYIVPLRLLAAYPTRRNWTEAAAPDLDALLDPTELPRLECLDPQARRKLLVQEIGAIYDLAEAVEAGLAAARERIDKLHERSPRIRSWTGPRCICWSTPTRPVMRAELPPRRSCTISYLAFGSTAASWTCSASASCVR
jgi:hypothetical protein